MKNILVITGPIAPLNSTNSNLMKKIVDRLSGYKIIWLSIGPYFSYQIDSHGYEDFTVYKYSTKTHCLLQNDIKLEKHQSIIAKVIGRIIDRNGYGEGVTCVTVTKYVRLLDKKYKFDMIFACTEPFAAGYAMAFCKIPCKKTLYLIDPPADIVPGMNTAVTPLRKNVYRKMLNTADLILSTDRIREALISVGLKDVANHIVGNEFPLLTELYKTPQKTSIQFDHSKINLLYCGWLRNEKYFVEILEKLDDRYCVTFLGNDNAAMKNIKTKAEVRVFPQVDRSVSVNAILDADVLVCIGNRYPVHIPSKTFDYIASGKPIIHIFSIDDCPANAYFERYPLALSISDQSDINESVSKVNQFCILNKSNKLQYSDIKKLYSDILESLILDILIKSIKQILLQ